MENIMGGISPGVLEPPMESSCKCFNIISGPMKLSCLHSQEDSRSSAGVSKVSQIATMFQPQQDFEEKQECLGPSQVSVVRTESHVARFNTARALFEKMSEQKGGGGGGGGERRPLKDASNKRIGSGSCGAGGLGRGTPSPSSSGGKSLSRSPSPCSPRSLIHSNGFSSYPTKPVSISGSPIPTISSLSSTSPPTPSTFHTTINNPSITSVLTHHIGTNILSPRTFSEASDPSRGGRWAPVIKSEISKPEVLNDRNLLEKHTTDKFGYNKTSSPYSKSSVSYSNEGNKLKNEDNVRYNVDNSRISSRENPCKSIKLDYNPKQEANTKFFTTNNFNNVDLCDSNKISKNHYNNKPDISGAKTSSSKSDYDSKPSKPTKPDLLSDKRLNTSHLQNQKIIQRHKNWFHTFSKSKSPASSPNKTDVAHHDPGSSIVGSRLQSSCNRPSYECEDNSYNHINSSRKHIKEVIYQKRKSLDDLDSISSEEIQATHNDWRRERAAILAGRANSRLEPGEEADKVKSTDEKVRNYDNVSTLPSSWCPPKQYNAAVKSSRSTSIPSGISDSQHDSSLRRSPLSGGDNTSESESRYSESGSNSGSFREGYVVKREISEVHRSSFDSQLDQRGNNQNSGRGHRESSPSPSGSSSLSRRSDNSKAKAESRARTDLVNERLQRHSNEKNSQEIKESKNDLESDVKLRKFKAMSTEDVSSRRSFDVRSESNEGSLKRNSYEVDRERRLKEWERKRIERGNRLSDEIKVHNIRVNDISAFTKNADKEKKENDEVIWVKRETNTGSLDSRRIKEERRRRDEDKSKDERLRRDEELERKRREALDRTHTEEKEREDIKKRKVEELERKRRDDLERKKLEEIERQKTEEEEKRRQAELEKERRKELELERKRKQEEIAKELEHRRLEEQREKNRLKEREEREKLQKEKQEAEEKIRQKEMEEREKLKKELEERERRLKEEERERLRKEKRDAEEKIRRQKEEEEREKKQKKLEERERKETEEMARRQKEEEEERSRQQKEEEERERIRIEKEEREKLETEERVRKEMEEEKIRKQKEEENKEGLLREEKELLQEEERIRKMTYQERIEEEERLKREKDRLEIEKTKRRIAELKREREELQRQQLMRMQQILVDEQGTEKDKVIVEKEEVIRINLDEISNEERESESIAALDALVRGHQKKPIPEHSEQELDNAKSKVEASLACLDSRSVNKEIPNNVSQLDHQESVEVAVGQEYLDENKSSNIEYALVGLDTSELTDVEVTDIETTDVDVTEVDQSTSSNSSTSHITDKSISERPELMLTKSEERRMLKTESSLDEVLQTPVDEVYYDPTVTSAQYKIEFCSSPLGIPINRDESKTGSSYRSQIIDSSTLSSEFEPLPPPIPPHNVNPATIMSGEGVDTPSVCQNEGAKTTDHDDRLEQMADLMEYVDADPEVMTPEEETKLLSHKADSSLLSDDQAKEVSQILAQTNDVQDGSCLSSQRSNPEVSSELPDIVQPLGEEESLRESSPPVDYDDDAEEEPSGVPVGQITTEGFVVRTKEVHYEDGIHYFEDGNFWIEVPGLQENDDEDEEDEFPEHIPFHKHTKLKFSTAPIQLFSTFSVTDYDRKNEDVDPVAASAEYELEKRVEKMDVFPVQIEKGEGGLGLSIIGMGVGADAGVEKLGIFVKTISPGGATDKDGRIKVNDQIIEVDNQSLVGVTQMYAASVLKNTNGTVNFLIGREQDPDNSEVAMLIRQSLMADMEREERRRALGGPNYDPNNGGGFESFSSPSGGDSPSEETSRNNISQYDEVGDVNPYGEEGCEDDYADSYGSCPSSPQPRLPSSPPEALKSSAENSTSEMVVLGQHLMEVQHKNRLHEEEIIKLRSKISELERELGDKVEISESLEDMTSRLVDIEDKLQSRQAEIATYQDMLEQSQGQYIVLEKKYYKAKKIIKEYQSRERDFLHREEYHITQLEEKDALYNSLVKALKDRVIQLEGDLIKAQQKAGLPVVLPPDLNAQSLNFVHSSQKGFGSSGDDQANVDQKEPPRKPASLGTLDPDLSDTEGCDTQTSESSKASTVERKIPLKEELDVAVPPHELLDVSFSKAKGELATRGGLAKRQLPSLKKTASSSSAGSFDRSLDDSADEGLPESHQQHLFSSAENAATSPAANISSSNVSSNSYTHHEEVFQQSISSSSQSSSSHSYSVSSSQHQTSLGNSFPQHNGFSRPPPPYHPPQGHNPPSYSSSPQSQYSQQGQLPHGQPHPSSYGNNHNESQHVQNVSHQSQSQPPPYQPPPSAPLSHRSLVAVETNTGRSDMPYRHPPPIARVQPVNRVEAPPEKPPTPTSPQYGPRTPQQQSLAHQLKTLLAEREANTEHSSAPQSPIKKSASMLMEDVRQAVIQADLSIGKKPMISAPIHMSSTAQVVSTGQFVQHRGSPVRNSGGDNSNSQQRISHDFGSWSPKPSRSNQNHSSSIVAPSNTSGVVLLSQRPIDSSLPPLSNEDCNLSSSVDRLHSGSQGSLVENESTSSFDSQPSPSHLQEKNRFPGYSREAESVLDWSKEQVGQWLVLQGMESHVGKFVSTGITGPRLVNIDTKDLKSMGLTTDEKNKIKRKVKELRQNLEKERKQIEKERKEREKLQKKAEKLAKEAEKRKK